MLREDIVLNLYNNVLSTFYDNNISVILLGGDARKPLMIRNKLRSQLSQYKQFMGKKFHIYYPEDTFVDLLYDSKVDLLLLETILAGSVNVIVICLESEGAIAELGAFVNHKDLSAKLIVIADTKHKKAKSFIRKGPLQLLESKKRVVWFDYKSNDVKDLGKKVSSLIFRVSHQNKVEQSLLNAIAVEELLLLVLYVFELTDEKELSRYIEKIYSSKKDGDILQIPLESANLIMKAALNSLLKKRNIVRQSRNYTLTKNGYIRLMETFPNNKSLSLVDNFRVEIMNQLLRK